MHLSLSLSLSLFLSFTLSSRSPLSPLSSLSSFSSLSSLSSFVSSFVSSFSFSLNSLTQALAPVTHVGLVDLQLDQPDGSRTSVKCDEWTWKFASETFYAYTTGSGNTGVKLYQWKVNLAGNNFTNTYLNYTAPTDVKKFDSQFQVPEQCRGNVLKCDEAFKMGKITEKSLKFVKAGN